MAHYAYTSSFPIVKPYLIVACLVATQFFVSLASAEQSSSESECFSRLASTSVPFEVYVGTNADRATFLQRRESSFGLFKNAVRFLDLQAALQITELCNGNFVAVWLPHTYKEPTYLGGRITDATGKPLGAEFDITEKREIQNGHSITLLYNGGFVVTWTTVASGGASHVRARVFNASGRPVTRSFNVSESGQANYNRGVAALPNGTFVVTWIKEGAVCLRIFLGNGNPSTDELTVASSREWKGGQDPFLWVSKDGSFTVFLVDPTGTFNSYREPVQAARRYDSIGQAVTPLQKGQEIKSLEGYQDVVESLGSDAMINLEYTLREYFTKDVMGFRFCSKEHTADTLRANRMKIFSRDTRKKQFFTSFCKQRLAECGRLEVKAEEQDQCLAEDDDASAKKE